jgi:DNA-binding beta-propeller fold protein YncE
VVVSFALAACGTPAAVPHSAPGDETSRAATPVAGSVNVGQLTLTLVAEHGPSDMAWVDYLCCYISAAPNGQLLVPHLGQQAEILELNPDASVARRWGESGTEIGQLGFVRDPQEPESAIGGIAVAPDGGLYVAEAGTKRVQRFGAAGEPELVWGSRGTGDGQFLDPIGVAVAPSGEVFVVDDERDDIQVFSPAGDYLRTIGRPGSGPGELRATGNVRVRRDGAVVNADFGNHRVQAWDAEGEFLWSLGQRGTGPGQFVEPQDIAFGVDGSLFVVDDSRVQVFDGDLNLIATWPEERSPDHLASIAVSGESLWVVAPYADILYEIHVSDAQ